jgi:cyclopropane fatty-acyl-phospholipid synthase-like methyltransferase
MTTHVAPARIARRAPLTVLTCYDLLHVAVSGGVNDFTEGKYLDDRNDEAAYLAAQERQAEYLLDEIRCAQGSRILDIGCGYGRVLQQAARRGAKAVGITISAPQVADCRRRGLEVYERNYRDIDSSWDDTFDGTVANGSLEHFAQIDDALADRGDAVYEEMFAICRRLLRPSGRMVTTAIHFRGPNQVRPEDMARGPYAFPRETPEYHFAMILERTFGGWFPGPGQLERCAQPYFRLVREEDGTHDYHLTSEYWLSQMKRSLARSPAVWLRLLQTLVRRPHATRDMLRCLVHDQSWMWQFRPPAPTRLLRHTWEVVA